MSIVELRQYTLHPGTRETLIELFEREFVVGQEAVGIAVGGRIRDLDDPDRFAWLRAFPDMGRRRRSLEAFYTGSVWQENRDAANATMIDSDEEALQRERMAAGVTYRAIYPGSAFDDPIAWPNMARMIEAGEQARTLADPSGLSPDTA
ncbi:NIPSNAP family protein [Streptomyces cinerochromogenes]|uniref:NIPSNAP family protein n=1 Tax=Streptomyces cinerochromogenes TaxID=66422 RepID=A0ABW7BAU6_9ACTN